MDLELILAIIRNQCDLEKYSKNKLRLQFRKEIAWKQSEVFLKGRTPNGSVVSDISTEYKKIFLLSMIGLFHRRNYY